MYSKMESSQVVKWLLDRMLSVARFRSRFKKKKKKLSIARFIEGVLTFEKRDKHGPNEPNCSVRIR